jgi:hypothetical protein
MAKGKHPGMGDRPDIHGDTGEGIAAYAPPPPPARKLFWLALQLIWELCSQNLGGEQWQKEGKGSKVVGGGRPEVNF